MQKFIAIGNVGQDPEVRVAGEHKVATLSLATTERGFTRKDGVKVEDRTEWHNIVLWRGLAEIAEKYGDYGEVKEIAKTNRYKLIGNAVTVNIVELVAKRIKINYESNNIILGR